MYNRPILLAGIALIIGNIFGCANTPSIRKSVCNELTAPNSYKVYLFLSKEYEPSELILQTLKNNTTYELLENDLDVKIVKDMKAVGNDGILLRIDIIRSLRGGVHKRIDIRYQVINTATREVMIEEKDIVKSRLGYNKITIKLAKRLAKKVNNLISCFENSREEPSLRS